MNAAAELFAVRIRAALAEAGYPNASVEVCSDPTCDALPDGCVNVGGASDAAIWTAYLVSGAKVSCWPCWNEWLKCEHDPWTSERPRLERAR